MPEIGQRFRPLKEAIEIRRPNGALLARFLPDFTYSLTPRNLDVISKAIAEGRAQLASADAAEVVSEQPPAPMKVTSPRARARGAFSTKG